MSGNWWTKQEKEVARPMSIMSMCAPMWKQLHEQDSRELWHLANHPSHGRRQYRRGKNRCSLCGRFLA